MRQSSGNFERDCNFRNGRERLIFDGSKTFLDIFIFIDSFQTDIAMSTLLKSDIKCDDIGNFSNDEKDFDKIFKYGDFFFVKLIRTS